ncbi:MAG TPA: GDSL-type esterase/lipase family protein [Capillimicrobium sp.]|nr:GDSL-type esterase/lipase family protein [Capillimicrobium sp.]
MLAAALAAAAMAHTAHALPNSGQSAIVSLGDSFISGEAGRWHGNSIVNGLDRQGTDRAYVSPLKYDLSRVYGNTVDNGCHRSDVAEIKQAAIDGLRGINVACSGAQTENVIRRSRGGKPFKGQSPQNDNLVSLARVYRVRAIVLSIGGNDLGFSNIIQACVTDYLETPVWSKRLCKHSQERIFRERLSRAMGNVRLVVQDIRALMQEEGYRRDDYRLILQSYPSPVPRSADMRYPEARYDRLTHGCPMWNEDLDWARGSLVPQIAFSLRAVAAREGAEFLDLQDLFDGHEPCSKTAELGGTKPAAQLEWARYVSMGILQGDLQEALHPNAIGQDAMGTCLIDVLARRGTAWACRAGAGVAPQAARVTPLTSAEPDVRVPDFDELADVGPKHEPRWPSGEEALEAAREVHAQDGAGED